MTILALEIKTIHRVLNSKQAFLLWLSIQVSTDIQQQSQNKFEENFKLNRCCDKTMESQRNRMTLKLVISREQLLQRSDVAPLCNCMIFGQNLAAVLFRSTRILYSVEQAR